MPFSTTCRPDRQRLRWTRATLASCLTALLVSLGGACCGAQVAEPSDAVHDPAVLLAHMRDRLDGLQSARFRVVIEYYDGRTRGANFRAAVLVRQPEDLHVQVLSPFGDPLRTLVSNGTRLSLYDLEAQTYYWGSPSPENIARILPFYMTAADIARVLLGGPPLDEIDPDPTHDTLEWDRVRGAYRLSAPFAHQEGHLDLWVRHGDWTVEAARGFDGSGAQQFELRTGNLQPTDAGPPVPMRLRFLLDRGDDAGGDIDMSIEVESAQINVDLPDSLFELEAPAGVEQVPLD
jgi:outer membrane lipoprotein-sorting protein